MALTNKTDLTDLSVGDFIWAKYAASSGKIGQFSNLAADLSGVYLNPDDKNASVVLSNGNMTAFTNFTGYFGVRASEGKTTGKWYWEAKMVTSNFWFDIGISNANYDLVGSISADANTVGVYPQSNGIAACFVESVLEGTNITHPALGEYWGFALDVDSKTLKVYTDGVLRVTLTYTLTGAIFPTVMPYDATHGGTVNFGATAFAHTIPAGYTAYSTAEAPNELTPGTGNETPNGHFKFICTGKDHLGRAKLVADRDIQTYINWNTLNDAGLCGDLEIKDIYAPVITHPQDLTSNTSSPGYEAIRSSVFQGNDSYEAYKAFDSTTAFFQAVVGTSNEWVGMKYPTPVVINSIMFKNYPSVYIIGNFRVEGSNDGTAWNPVYSGIGANVTGSAPQYFLFSNTVEYSYWRLYVESMLGGSYVTVVELEFGYVDQSLNTEIRLLTGGISETDKDNEWDKILGESTLDGNITAGDEAIWNGDKGVRSWTRSVDAASNARVARGSTGIDYYAGGNSETTIQSYFGFRPVLLIEDSAGALPPSINATLPGGVSTHTTNLTVGGDITSVNLIQYRIKLNGTYVYPDGIGSYTTLATGPVSLNYTIQATDLLLGSNTLVIEAKDDLEQESSFSETITKANASPTDTLSASITTTHNTSVSITGDLTDTDSDQIEYRISVRGAVAVDWTIGTSINYTILASALLIGDNAVLVEYRDKIHTEYGATQQWTETITKTNTVPTDDLSASSVTTHFNDITISGTLTDPESDSTEYRILLNAVVKVDWTVGSSISHVITPSELNVGTNDVLVEYRDIIDTEYGATQQWTETITFTNENPTIAVSSIPEATFNTSIQITGTINDADADPIVYRFLLNGVEYQSWSVEQSTPYDFSHAVSYEDLQLGSNTITFEYTDSLGALQTWSGIVQKKSIDSIYYDSSDGYKFEDTLLVNATNTTLIRIPDLVRNAGYVKNYQLDLTLVNGVASSGDVKISLISQNWSSGTFSIGSPPTIDTEITQTYTINDNGAQSIDITELMVQIYDRPISYGLAIEYVDLDIEIDALNISKSETLQATQVNQPTGSHGDRVDLITWESLLYGTETFIQLRLLRSTTPDFAIEAEILSSNSAGTLSTTDTTNIVEAESYYYRVEVTTSAGTTYTSPTIVPVPIPAEGYKTLFEVDEYVVYLSDGIAFGVPGGVDDFYTTPDRIAVKPLDLNDEGTIIGGVISPASGFELINAYNDKTFSITLYASTDADEEAEDVGYSGRIDDNELDQAKTLVEFSLTDDPAFNADYPLIFTLAPQEKKILYVRIKPSIYTTVGAKSFKVKVKGSEI